MLGEVKRTTVRFFLKKHTLLEDLTYGNLEP